MNLLWHLNLRKTGNHFHFGQQGLSEWEHLNCFEATHIFDYFGLFKSPESTIDHLKVEKLERNFELAITNDRY
jgi:hypothetical protein